jgi:hypothetical protein
MLSRQSLPTIIVVMACALLTLILTLLSAGLSLSHDPMMGSQLQQLASAQSYASDVVMYEHANHSTEDMPSSHQHGHSNVDHTHESLFLPPEHTTVSEFGLRQWGFRPQDSLTNALVGVLERPPKSKAA